VVVTAIVIQAVVQTLTRQMNCSQITHLESEQLAGDPNQKVVSDLNILNLTWKLTSLVKVCTLKKNYHDNVNYWLFKCNTIIQATI